MNIELNKIYNMDCLEGMKLIDDKSIDMILCDLPYGTTACKWDSIIPFEPLWEQYERIIKDNGAIVLTASQPFTSQLVNSNIKNFRYEWIWEKEQGVNFPQAKKQPLKSHENICVFYKKQPNYKPQMIDVGKGWKSGSKSKIEVYGGFETIEGKKSTNTLRYPKTVQRFNREYGLHPTQKPVALFEYLIKTYTNENEIVLDNCIGSGTTAIASIHTNRNFIGFEQDEHYFNLANKRIEDELNGK